LAEARRRKRVFSRKMRVQQFNEVIELLRPTGLKVLRMLGAGNTATVTAARIGCAKSNITYWKNKLLRLGLLRLQVRDVYKIYSLTVYGSKVLTRSEGMCVPVETVVLEDHAVKFRVVEGERVRLDWRKLGRPRNWVKLGVKIGGVSVVRTSKHVIIHPGKLRGWDTKELVFDSGRIVERVKEVLESRFGMVLSDVAVPLHKPVFRFYSEEAKQIVKHGTIIVHNKNGERLGAIDDSPPERVPHEEYNGEELGRQRLLFPFTLRRLEEKVDTLTKDVDKLVDTIQKFTDTFSKLLPRESPSPKNVSEKRVDYVA
jgi:hypothetical protein